MRKYARLDATHKEIVAEFIRLGCKVQSLATIGNGCPDLVVAVPGHDPNCIMVEVKDGSKPPSKRGLTEDQIRWHANWSGRIWTIESVEQVAECVSYYRCQL